MEPEKAGGQACKYVGKTKTKTEGRQGLPRLGLADSVTSLTYVNARGDVHKLTEEEEVLRFGW